MAPIAWAIYRVFAIVEILTLSVIIVYDHYRSTSAPTKLPPVQQQRNPRWTRAYRALSETYIILTFLYSLNLVLSQSNAYQISDDYGCYVRIVVNSILYNTSKAVLYCLLVARLCASYNATPYYVSRKIIVSLFVSIAIYTIYAIYNIITVLSGYIVSFDASSISQCRFYAPNILSVLVVLLFDLIISIILVILFLKPIHKLLKRNKNDEDFLRIIIKTSTLTSWVIFSNLVSIAIYSVFLNSIIVLILDNIINVVGVLLMKQIHDSLYKKACRPFNKCCLCLCCCGYQNNLLKPKRPTHVAIDQEQSQPTERNERKDNGQTIHSQEKQALKGEESKSNP